MRLPRVRFTLLGLAISVTMAVALGSCVAVVIPLLSPGVNVTVCNETEHQLTKVQISFRGGKRKAERIAPGRSASWKIIPSGESSVSLSYKSQTGTIHRVDANVYIESGYRGSLELRVRPNGVWMTRRIIIFPPS